MTYFGFLLQFILIPILILLAYHLLARPGTGVVSPPARLVWAAIGIHVLLALFYTTPWDNYLVATGVWFYNPEQVTGILLGYVPLEEYTFFILQSVFVGLWWWLLARRLSPRLGFASSAALRFRSTLLLSFLWVLSALIFFSRWAPATYVSITAFWALPPLVLQSAFGADILWHARRLLVATIFPLSLYLSFVDSLAITAATWQIDPLQSSGLFIGSLPLEEAFFFFITVILLGSGITLLTSSHSHQRLRSLLRRVNLLSRRDPA